MVLALCTVMDFHDQVTLIGGRLTLSCSISTVHNDVNYSFVLNMYKVSCVCYCHVAYYDAVHACNLGIYFFLSIFEILYVDLPNICTEFLSPSIFFLFREYSTEAVIATAQ